MTVIPYWTPIVRTPEQQAEIDRTRAEDEARAAAARAANTALTARCEAEGTRIYIRYGFARSGYRSTNHRDNRLEDGLSCYAAYRLPDGTLVLDMRGVDYFSFLFGGFAARQAYEVRSKQGPICVGSDGEPIIARFTLKKINLPEETQVIH